jgi:hypothetical protein
MPWHRARARRVRLPVWIATLAIVMASLAPGLSQAIGSSRMSALEVCSASGTKWIRGTLDDSGDAPQVPGLDHCPYCTPHATTFGLPPTQQSFAHFLDVTGELPRVIPVVRRRLCAWTGAQPRAPPPR